MVGVLIGIITIIMLICYAEYFSNPDGYLLNLIKHRRGRVVYSCDGYKGEKLRIVETEDWDEAQGFPKHRRYIQVKTFLGWYRLSFDDLFKYSSNFFHTKRFYKPDKCLDEFIRVINDRTERLKNEAELNEEKKLRKIEWEKSGKKKA